MATSGCESSIDKGSPPDYMGLIIIMLAAECCFA
jgi:hypothetical protein